MALGKFQNVNVLVCDDEKLMQRLVYDVLTQLGFTSITVANSGQRAIELLKQGIFDFVITDWRMHDVDGIDLLRFIRTSPESLKTDIPVIMLTGNTETNHVFTARDAGVNEYVIKPFTAEQLAKRIRSIVERPRAFVDAPAYKGPERRHNKKSPPSGINRRKGRPT